MVVNDPFDHANRCPGDGSETYAHQCVDIYLSFLHRAQRLCFFSFDGARATHQVSWSLGTVWIVLCVPANQHFRGWQNGRRNSLTP